MNINLGVGRVQNVTAKNVFTREKSLYEFIKSAIGNEYSDLSKLCDSFYDKGNEGKYFGQIITPINFLGLIQTDDKEVLVENELLDYVWESRNARLATYYMNYFLCMWQYPLPSTQKNSGRDLRIFKPYCLLLKMLLEINKIAPDEAYFTTYDYSEVFLEIEDDLPALDEIDEQFAREFLRNRGARELKGITKENGSLTYIINTLAESDVLTKDSSSYDGKDNFYIGLKKSRKCIFLAEFIVRTYGKKIHYFDVNEAAGKRVAMTEYCEYINSVEKFNMWRKCYVNISRISDFKDYCEDKGFHYTEDLIRRFVLSLETKPFLLLTGISGSGKTKIAELWISFLQEKNEAEGLQIAVGSNWTDNKKLLGFNNVLLEKEEAFQTTALVELMKRAEIETDKEFIVILDEMNLSRVEMYFADFLSALEALDKKILLADGTIVRWNNNLKIIGTVNVDESTYMFSPKVLDRANVIEMNGVSPKEYIDAVADSSEKIYNTIKNETWFDSYVELLNDVYDDLNGEFAYRVIDEITSYIALNIQLYGQVEYWKYVDEQVSQKILPKLHGSKAQLKPKLDALQKTFADKECPLINGKLEQMQEDVKKGYTSFIGD